MIKSIGFNTKISRRDSSGRVGAVVCSSAGTLYAIACAHIIPGTLSHAHVETHLAQQDCLPTPKEICRDGRYVSVVAAIRLFRIPNEVVVDKSLNIVSHMAIDDISHRQTLTLKFDGGVYEGSITAFHSPFEIIDDDGLLNGFLDAVEVTLYKSASARALKALSGSAVLTESGELVGFMIAANEKKWMMAPADAVFSAYGFRLATRFEIEKHNALVISCVQKINEPTNEVKVYAPPVTVVRPNSVTNEITGTKSYPRVTERKSAATLTAEC